MHVKLVVPSFPVASETFLFNLVVALEARGVRVTVCSLSAQSHNDLFKDRLKEWSGNLEIIPLESNLVLKLFKILQIATLDPVTAYGCIRKRGLKRGALTLVQLFYLKSGMPDIIHFTFSGLAIQFMEALQHPRVENTKVFVSCRGTAEKVKPITDPSRSEQLRELFECVDKVHCVSHDMMEGLLEYGLRKDKVFINYPSIKVDSFKRKGPYNFEHRDKWRLLTTGRLNFQKGYIFGLLALKKLKERGHNFTYNILGEGSDRDMLSYVIHELDLTDEVRLHGKVSSRDVTRLLDETDIFILPSLYEGIANAALEAMAMDIPVVTTTAGGMSEVVRHRFNGMIVDRFDQTSFADAVEELFMSRDLRRSISENARRTIVKNFNSQKQTEIFIKEYESAVNGAKLLPKRVRSTAAGTVQL